MRQAHRILGCQDQAQDVAQETLVAFLSSRRANISHPEAFVYRAATNRALNLLRNKRRRQEILYAARSEETHDINLEMRMAARQLLAEAPADEARVAACFYFDGMDQKEIAEVLDIHPRAVSRKLARFQQRGRKQLGMNTRENTNAVSGQRQEESR
jgi:RNA polymerase sigma factor (sigma-70 family)